MFGLDKTLSAIVACLVAAAVLVVLVFGGLYLSERRKAQEARAEARVAVGSQNAGKGAVEALEGQIEANQKSQELGRENASSIAGADNAGTSAGQAGERAYLAWCKRERLRGNSLSDSCNRLLSLHP